MKKMINRYDFGSKITQNHHLYEDNRSKNLYG